MSTSQQGYGPDHETGLSLGLHHVLLAIPPGSEDQVRPFYVGILKMIELRKPPALAARGGLWVRGVEDEFRPARKAHPGIRVAALDALAERFAAADMPVVWDSADFPGHRRFYADDPVGNRIEFIQRDETIRTW